jgi:ribonuclease D
VPASPRIERALYLKLQEVRQKLAVNGRIRVSEVASNTLLKEIARYAPSTLAELDQIPGFRSSALRNEGPQILTFVAALRSREDSSPSS